MVNRDDPDGDDDAFAEDDMFTQRERYGAGAGARTGQRPRVVSEFVRRAIENTVGSMSNTGNLSREALNYLLQQGDKGKREMVRIVAQEVSEFLKGVDLSSEVVKVLSNLQVDVNASIRFKQTKDGSITPEITHDAVVKDTDAVEEIQSAEKPEPTKPPPEGT